MQNYDMKEYGINMNENSCNFGPTIIDNDLKNKTLFSKAGSTHCPWLKAEFKSFMKIF